MANTNIRPRAAVAERPPFVAPPSGNTRLGLFHTSDEVAIWADRAVNGPYKTAGDESTNSPGDWDRIVTNKNSFASNPSTGRWINNLTLTGSCVESPGNYDWPEPGDGGTYWSDRLRDAAFFDLVTNVTTHHAAIKAELLWVSSQTYTDFGDPSGIWCFGTWMPSSDTAPTFGITSCLTNVLLAYDFMPRTAFSSGELDQIDRWFFDAADYWRHDIDVSLGNIYVNRLGGNYTFTDSNSCTYDNVAPYVGGPVIATVPAKFYNNRRGSIVRFYGLAGIMLDQAGRSYTDGRAGTLQNLLDSAKLYCNEYVRFSLFPNGYVGDFERVTDSSVGNNNLAEVGWAYSSVAIANVVAVADAFARIGDTSVYDYNTASGGCNTVGTINDGGSRQGENRDILYAVQSFMKYHTDIYARYYLSNDSPTDANRIDGRYDRTSNHWGGFHDTHMIMINNFYKDTFIKQAYTRTHSGAVSYPASPAFTGSPPYTGENGVFPAMLFMFGQMEDLVDVYP